MHASHSPGGRIAAAAGAVRAAADKSLWDAGQRDGDSCATDAQSRVPESVPQLRPRASPHNHSFAVREAQDAPAQPKSFASIAITIDFYLGDPLAFATWFRVANAEGWHSAPFSPPTTSRICKYSATSHAIPGVDVHAEPACTCAA